MPCTAITSASGDKMATDTVFLRELENSSELCQTDREQESYLVSVSNFFSSIKETVVSSIVNKISTIIGVSDTIYSIVTQLAVGLLNIIASLSVLFTQSIPGWVKALQVTSVVGSFTSLVLSLSTIAKQYGVTWSTSDATEVSKDIVRECFTTFEQSAQSSGTIQVTANSFSLIKELGTKVWLKLGITSLIAVLFAGLGLSKAMHWKDLVLSSNVVDSVRKTANNLNGVADYVLDEVMQGLDDPDYPICKKLEDLAIEGERLQRLSPAHFVQHPNDMCSLNSFMSKIIEHTRFKISDKASKRYNTVRQLLLIIFKNLEEKRKSIDAILATKPRQVTVGVLLSGPPGHGKSEFGKYLCKLVAERLGYDPGIYSLNKRTDGFFEPYGGQSFGAYNEWMALKSEDPLLRDLNLIFSSDPMNFEAASLEGKVQPCKLKLAFLTSNTETPDLVRVLDPGAVEAVWDRLYHVRVDDPLCRGRHAPNPHRKSDFSHLQFQRITHSTGVLRSAPITLQELISRLVGRCADAERKYISDLVSSLPDGETKSELLTRESFLKEILKNNSPFDHVLNPDAPFFSPNTPIVPNAGKGRDFFVFRFQGVPGSGKTTFADNLSREMSVLFSIPVQYSSCVSEFKPVDDKPYIYILDDWVEEEHFQDFVELSNQTDPRSVFFVCSNTVLTRSMNWRLGDMTRYVIERYLTGGIGVKPWDLRSIKSSSGVARRIGAQGFTAVSGGDIIQNSELIQRTYTFDGNYVIRDAYDVIRRPDEITSDFFRLYRQYLKVPPGLTIVDGTPPFIDDNQIGIKISGPDSFTVMRALRSKLEMMKIYSGKHPTVSIFLNPELVGAGAQTQTLISQWMIHEEPTDDPAVLRSVFIRFCVSFQRCFPGKSLSIQLQQDDVSMYFKDNVAYIYNPSELNLQYSINYIDNKIEFYRTPNEPVYITLDEYVAARNSCYTGVMADLSLSEIRYIHKWVSMMVHDDSSRATFRVAYAQCLARFNRKRNIVLLKVESALRSNPIFWAAVSLLSLVAVGGLVYTLYRYFFGSSNTLVNSNSMTPRESRAGPPSHEMPAKLSPLGTVHSNWNVSDPELGTRKRSDNDRIFRQIRPYYPNVTVSQPTMGSRGKTDHDRVIKSIRVKGNGIQSSESRAIFDKLKPYLGELSETEVNHVHDEIDRLISINGDVPDEAAFATFLAYVQGGCQIPLAYNSTVKDHGFEPKENLTMQRVSANMLRSSDMIPQKETAIELMHRKLNKLYVKVINPNDNTFCYGVGLHGKYILTVSHMFDKIGDESTIVSDGHNYKARCVYLERPRDLAVVYVTDKHYPTAGNTLRFFHPKEELQSALYGWFVRCGPTFEAMGGAVGYYPTTTYPLGDKNTPNFKLTDKVVVFCAAAMYNTRDFVKLGDCGFPVITQSSVTKEYRILGVHVAYNQTEKVYFSAFTREDHVRFCAAASDYVSNAGNSLGVSEVELKDGSEWMLPDAYIHAFENLEPNINFIEAEDRLDIVGYSKMLNLRSFPKGKHKLLDLPNFNTPLVTAPAAYTLEYVKDASKLYSRIDGSPDPLFTQCLKYDRTRSISFDADTFDYAVHLVQQDLMSRYGNCRFLTLYNLLNGIPGEPLAALETGTSAGPLLKLLFGINTKAPLLDVKEPYHGRRTLVLNDSDAARMVRDHFSLFKDSLLTGGPPPLMISKDCAKVELLEASKAHAGKVRLFNEVDLSINLVLKYFFGDFQNKVMAAHEFSPIRLGQDPYRCASHIVRQFNEIDGNIVSTDFSSFDKQLPSSLIAAFCYCVSTCYSHPSLSSDQLQIIYHKLALMLTRVAHTCRGTIYFVDRGNESGTFVTTILNSVSVQILTYYTVVRKWRDIFKFMPSLGEILAETRLAILGDDRTFKCTRALDITQQDFILDSEKFCLVCTEAKSGGEIVFCSRELLWDERHQIAWPALKQSSVISQLHWYSEFSREQIYANLDGALFEASLHQNPKFHLDVLKDAMLVCDHFRLPISNLVFMDRMLTRSRFVSYIRDDEQLRALSEHVDRGAINVESFDSVERATEARDKRDICLVGSDSSPAIEAKRAKRFKSSLSSSVVSGKLMSNPRENPVSALYERLRAARIPDSPVITYVQDGDSFECTVTLLGHSAVARGPSKSSAKRSAFADLYNVCANSLESAAKENEPVLEKSRKAVTKLAHDYMYKSIHQQLGMAIELSNILGRPVHVLSNGTPVGRVTLEGTIRYLVSSDDRIYMLSWTSQQFPYREMHSVYLAQPGTEDGGETVYVGRDETRRSGITPNSASGAGPLPSQAMGNPGLSTIPHLSNPTPSNVAPAMQPNPPATMGALEMLDEDTLNTVGPPNMLATGAIQFDIKDLVYNQFLDSDQLYQITNSTAEGAIILQIPYSLTSKYVNAYIRQYVSLHERFAGDLLYRITLVGNQTFSGLIGVAWLPRAVDGNVIKISEAQKYSYSATTVNEMWNKSFRLMDARKDSFYRNVADEGDEKNRPHLVFFVVMAAQSPLTESITVRLRVASKLADNFQVANPIIPGGTLAGPGNTPTGYQADITRLIGSAVLPTLVRPYTYGIDTPFYMIMDGSTWFSQPLYNSVDDYQITSFQKTSMKKLPPSVSSSAVNRAYKTQVWITGPKGVNLVYINTTRAPGFSQEFRPPIVNNGITTMDGHSLNNAVQNAIRTENNIADIFTEIRTQYAKLPHKELSELFQLYSIFLTSQKPTFNIWDSTNKTYSVTVKNVTAGVGITPYGPVYILYFNTGGISGDFPVDDIYVSYNPSDYLSTITQVKQVYTVKNPEAMPVGWRHVAFGCDLPYVMVEGVVASTMPSHPSIKAMIEYLGLTLKSTECLQMTLADIESGRNIATVRYFGDRQSLAINVGTSNMQYAASLRPLDRMFLSAIGVVERTQDFPITDLGNFADSQNHPSFANHFQ